MNIDCVVNILGDPWRVRVCSAEVEPRLKDDAGFVDWTSHFIGIADPYESPGTIDNQIEFTKQVARHEIVHAFMYQSGLGEDWEHSGQGQDETTVDWIARQFHAMGKIIDKVEKLIEGAEE